MTEPRTATAPERTTPLGRRRSASAREILRAHPTLGPLVVLVVSVVVFGLINTRFFSPANLSIMLQEVAVIGLLALGQTIIILTAGIDLSVGAAMILAQMVMAGTEVNSGVPAGLALVIGLLVALLTGLANGFLVTRLRVPPFIATLGTLGVFTAAGLKYANGQTVNPPQSSILLWSGKLFGAGSFRITTGVVTMLVFYLAFAYILGRTAWGRHVYAVGDDIEAARLSGIHASRVLLSVYLIAGLIYGVAGWVQIGRVSSASTNISPTLNLDSITAVVIGGVSLFGGRGAVLGTLLGALIVQVFQNGLALAGVQELYQQLAEGLLVIAAVSVDRWIRGETRQ
ncbi:monosaccharide ABC transporter membrane protein, CUT2 family [Acidothermus cellulolyticus 11B]|uniref:Monosaccharide ABC transporter membrane protein, CUT2 family n=1 Tax=Acidothermus cellulolyticus (strain ATCC 43068 / DSM 8971 / 11B) TaxID=351607 RepID=A0LST1_ACIC1|nr:monosaccharide ABC transporter membrane protein, CUT2 family [Acidothermus cellulolyticus 11B]MBX5447138.1 ABC transporter permease [Acidothermus cellulolyticus]